MDLGDQPPQRRDGRQLHCRSRRRNRHRTGETRCPCAVRPNVEIQPANAHRRGAGEERRVCGLERIEGAAIRALASDVKLRRACFRAEAMMIDHGQDHYLVLDLAPSATDAEIKRRYRALMRTVHPDANVDDPEATRKAAAINRAFETLGNARRRSEYDAERASARRSAKGYAAWAAEPNWEDIVVENVPPRRPAHVHRPPPTLEPQEIEIAASALRAEPRLRRPIRITNNCDCTMTGDVSTSEPWLWG